MKFNDSWDIRNNIQIDQWLERSEFLSESTEISAIWRELFEFDQTYTPCRVIQKTILDFAESAAS